jgi:hypothetical protein
MMTIFLVNGEERRLEMRDKNNIDWSGDFIGNENHGMKRDEEGRYLATQEEYEWWDKAIAAHQEMNELIDQYKEKYGDEAVHEALRYAFDTDLEMYPKYVKDALSSLDD